VKTAQTYDWDKWQQESPEQGEQSPLSGGQSYGQGDIDTNQSLIHPFQSLYDYIENTAIPQLGNTQEVLMKLMESIPSEFFPEEMEGQWPDEMYEMAFENVTVLKDWLETKVPQSRENMDEAYNDLRDRFSKQRLDKKWQEIKKNHHQKNTMDSAGGTTKVGYLSELKNAYRMPIMSVRQTIDADIYKRVFAQVADKYEEAAARLLNIGVAKFNPSAQKQYINKAAHQYGLNPLKLYNTLMSLWATWNERGFDKNMKGNAEAMLQMFNETWPTPDELYKLCAQYKIQPQTVISMFRSLSQMDETRWQTLVDMIDHYRQNMPANRILDWMSLLYGIPSKQVEDTYNMMKARSQFG
jgi:hypothetical protein